jgi:catechol 2,3-dioxygenase-like lactoylglutathione lyase family enzyme
MKPQGQSSQADSVVKVEGIHHAGIACNDLNRAVDFYTRVLGMKVMLRTDSESMQGHFVGTRLPPKAGLESAEGEEDMRQFESEYRQVRPDRPRPATKFARMKAGVDEVVLFERLDRIESDTLVENGIFHQSFHISCEDMDRLAEMKRQGNSDIRFHTGPVLRWPTGRALYLWDSEGNYIELESEEDLPAKYGIRETGKGRPA